MAYRIGHVKVKEARPVVRVGWERFHMYIC